MSPSRSAPICAGRISARILAHRWDDRKPVPAASRLTSEAQLAAQHGACACCGKKLGRVRRVHRKADGAIGLLCQRCCQLVASLRHVRKHADAFEAYMKEWGMTVELGRFYEVMRRCGWTPEQSASGGRPT